ncbi:hypothetical protein ABW636_01675 [Aquimarina sp. 2201CG1-2-11]|uniref:hypothetical protein n=1 Tax=Aquimarina discodermiae TaxID=3231043 RepID=UPI00346344AC
MSQKIITLSFLLLPTFFFAQNAKDATFFSQKDQVDKFHTISDLEVLKKGELIALYQDRVTEILTILPYLSLTNEANIRLSDIGIKEDSKHLKVLKNSSESTNDHIEVSKETIEELVPYADTEKIIWTVLFYEDVIKKMRIGTNGNL